MALVSPRFVMDEDNELIMHGLSFTKIGAARGSIGVPIGNRDRYSWGASISSWVALGRGR